VKTRPRLTRARLRELLRYNPNTGQFRWRKRLCNNTRVGDLAGHIDAQRGVHLIHVDHRPYRAHQLAWFYMTGRWGRPTVDHRDRDPINNRWNNLRQATQSQNNANRRRSRANTSGYKGVHLCRRSGKWRARLRKNRRVIYQGTFATPQAAHAAYVAAARKLYGEFARTE
jgi:hypothetical protein